MLSIGKATDFGSSFKQVACCKKGTGSAERHKLNDIFSDKVPVPILSAGCEARILVKKAELRREESERRRRPVDRVIWQLAELGTG